MSKNADIVKDWLELAYSDLEMAEIAAEKNKYMHCGFHLQQSLEKAIKGLIIKLNNKQPPYIHDLLRLSDEISKTFPEIQKYTKLLSAINPFYIKARYPSYKKKISSTLTQQTIENYLQKTKEVINCIEQKIQ
jgi:HEPN domain-containing protein